MLAGAAASASPLLEAQQEVAKARNKYLRAIYANPKRTGDDEVKLYREIVAPAESKLNSAFGQTFRDAEEKIFGPSRRQLQMMEKTLGHNPAQGASGPVSSQPPEKSAKPGAPGPGPSKPEVVLDGKGIPKELEFSGKPRNKQKGSPPPKSSVTPESEPVETVAPAPLPAAAGGVDELEFRGARPRPQAAPSPSKKK